VTKKITNLPASVHDRLARIAEDNRQTFEQVFYIYALERFLYRLSKSEYGQAFVLKGALMFLGWGLPMRRLTKDIDLQGYTSNDVDSLVHIIRQACLQEVEPDGMHYDPQSVSGEIIIEEADYEGVRIQFIGYLGNAKIHLQVDVSFADEITPAVQDISYPTVLPELGMEPFPVQGYPIETSISEKLQTMVVKDEINSRMKDFYDVYVLIQQFEFQGASLVNAITNTFRKRKTPIPESLPVPLTDTFAELKLKDWAGFYRRLPSPSHVPSDFKLIIHDLRVFLLPPLLAASNSDTFELIWFPGKGWLKK